MTKRERASHVVIPDTQVKPGVPTKHLEWIAADIVARVGGKPNVTIVVLGDWHDMPSLSSYDRRGGKLAEARRYKHDIQAGNDAWELFNAPIRKVKGWNPRRVFLMGNHEQRIERVANDDAIWDGFVTTDDLAAVNDPDYETHKFLEPVWIDGICYSHYFASRGTGRAMAGANMLTRLRQVGHSFTMGHQQGMAYANDPTLKGMRHALVAGSCYLHDEDYLGPQGNSNHWRGYVICHDVKDGDYDLFARRLSTLCEEYEGRTLTQFKNRKRAA